MGVGFTGLGTLLTGLYTYLNSRTVKEVKAKTDIIDKKTDDQNQVINEIHKSTNSGFDKVNQANMDLEHKLETVLSSRLAELEKDKALHLAKITNLESELLKRADAAPAPNNK